MVDVLSLQLAEMLIKDKGIAEFPIHMAAPGATVVLPTLCVGAYVYVKHNDLLPAQFCQEYRFHTDDLSLRHVTKKDPQKEEHPLQVPTQYCVFEIRDKIVDKYKDWKAHMKAADLVKKGDWNSILTLIKDAPYEN